MSTLYRAQLLLEAEQHAALAKIAEQEARSVSDLVREIVRQHLAERDREAELLAAMQAMERLTEIRTRLQEEKGIYQANPLAEARAEWEEDVERIGRGET